MNKFHHMRLVVTLRWSTSSQVGLTGLSRSGSVLHPGPIMKVSEATWLT